MAVRAVTPRKPGLLRDADGFDALCEDSGSRELVPVTSGSQSPAVVSTAYLASARQSVDLVRHNEWRGLVNQRSDDLAGVTLIGVLQDATKTWAGPFRGLCSDDNDYFVKSLCTCPLGAGASLASELIVSRLAQLIGAPACTTRLVKIDELTEGARVSPSVVLEKGWGFGSLAIERAAERKPNLEFRSRDDNRRRHVGAYAMYDWCWGADAQWLHDLDEDQAIFSHDHGMYFPPAQTKRWSFESLLYVQDNAHMLADSTEGLSPSAIENVASALERVSREDIAAVLNGVPSSWPVSNEDLEYLGAFLEHRKVPAAERLRNLPLGATGRLS